MSREILLPPDVPLLDDGSKAGGWWHTTDDDRIVCDLCPRACSLKAGDRGFCFVRENRAGEMVLTTYGRSTGFCIDPIEKKPLNHFLPGTSVLSFGTAGCNLGCKFCQNWDISKSREVERLSETATPEMIAAAARQFDCHSVAFTYNDPVIWAEYAMDVAEACRRVGVKTVAVTAGYVTPQAREPFFRGMDAANVDLKAFTEDFYFKLTQSHIQPVLDTLRWLKSETDVWFEITNLLIPRANDDPGEIEQMCHWILDHVGDDVPVHFSAFHPDFRMRDRERTPKETLLAAKETAERCGIKFAYVGNVDDVANQSTYCSSCRRLLIERNWYELGRYHMDGDRCGHCGERIAGVFERRPGNWGRKRLPVRISDFASRSTMTTPPEGRKETDMATESSATTPMRFDENQARQIHRFACTIVASTVLGRATPVRDAALAGAADSPVMGAFVTLKRKDRLRACCGFLNLERPTRLIDAVRHAAQRTAREDHRFPSISPTELPYLTVDVQLLHSPDLVRRVGADRVHAVQVGKHGLQIRRGDKSGLLLPVVAVEGGFDPEEFLRQVCLKAGLPTTAWQHEDTQLLTFEGESIPGRLESSLVSPDIASAPLLNETEMANLAGHCHGNLLALIRGATPNYYLFGCSDASVSGVALRMQVPGQEGARDIAKLSLRGDFPLQATVFGLIEEAAAALRSSGFNPNVSPDGLRVDLTVLYDPAMHGSLSAPDLDGLDARRRSLLLMEGNKSCWIYDPSGTAERLLDESRRAFSVRNPDYAQIFSLAALSTAPKVTFRNFPSPVPGPEKRLPAVAGSFYPDSPEELDRLVEQLLGDGHQDAEKMSCSAVMVPHAGLRYSGRVAAETLKRVRIPETVIVIGPKHTRFGVDWAVAPHESWVLPGGEVSSDTGLARRLADSIEGLELDAMAHAQEHGIEVELPFLAKLSPQTRVVGIAMSGGTLEECRRFAGELAAVLRDLDPKPLLIVSSDMNHYAPDDENRRLDELALSAMESTDPEQLFQTVQQHAISMCGVLPAVVVMAALQQLGALREIRRVSYATSADVSGDKSRVVGYAGMLLV